VKNLGVPRKENLTNHEITEEAFIRNEEMKALIEHFETTQKEIWNKNYNCYSDEPTLLSHVERYLKRHDNLMGFYMKHDAW